MKYKVSGAIAIPKASWGCAPALPNRIRVVSQEPCFTWNTAFRENGLPHPAKGGSIPAFACQRAAIAPLPCLNLQPYFSSFNFIWIGQFQKMQLQQENQFEKNNLLRKCGLLAHTSAAFLKNCCTEKLLFRLWLEYCSLFLFWFYVM